MKRFVALLFVILLSFACFSACTEKTNDTSSDHNSSAFAESSVVTSSDGGQSSMTEDSSEDSSSAISDESDNTSVPEEERPDGFPLSSIDDLTDENGTRTYTVHAQYTDTYKLEGTGITSVTLLQDGEEIATGDTSLTASLTEDTVYTLTVTTANAKEDFTVTTTAENHLVTLPYDTATPIDITGIDLNGTEENPLVPAEVNYIKRKGGTYIYSNNPEQFGAQHVGKAFMRNEGLKGEVYVTFEHANYANQNVYLGYQLKNDTDHDVYITITNVGYQWIGTWFGQLAWYDFYNTSFELPDDYFGANGAISSKYAGLDYAYQKYTPRVYQPTTYRLPAGEYFWVIGGTSADAYRNINVDDSANHYVNPVRCANGNVKFTVTGGEVTGTMYCYTNASQVAANPAPLGYVASGYAQQYSGIADHHGVIDNFMTWTFNDNTNKGMLPVTYTNRYADYIPSVTTPHGAYKSKEHTVSRSNTWMTHLNPQNNHSAVGMDMVDFLWHNENGIEIVIDNDHADGSGQPANTANWMIEYQDHFTFVNQGDTERTITLHLRDHGTLAILVRDSATGDVLEAAYTTGLGEQSGVFSNYTYQVTIPAHSVKQITLDYLLVACSYGSVIHAVELQ